MTTRADEAPLAGGRQEVRVRTIVQAAASREQNRGTGLRDRSGAGATCWYPDGNGIDSDGFGYPLEVLVGSALVKTQPRVRGVEANVIENAVARDLDGLRCPH